MGEASSGAGEGAVAGERAGTNEWAGADEPAGPDEWSGRFEQQAAACDDLGSPLWARLLRIVAADVRAEGPSWSVLRERAGLRFGQAGPLRLVGAAHRLALAGSAPEWASLLPSCGGEAPPADADGERVLRSGWAGLVDHHGDALVAGLDREVQTNEVGRAAALGYAHAVALADRGGPARLVEIGCSGGLDLRLDRFGLDLSGGGSGPVLGDPDGRVRLAPEMSTVARAGLSTVGVVERTGIDPHPIDPTSVEGRLTLLSFVWPDQVERFARLAAAIDLAREVPAELVATAGRRLSTHNWRSASSGNLGGWQVARCLFLLNVLTGSGYDPVTDTAELKVCPVRVEAVDG